jgi:hypothetical protein
MPASTTRLGTAGRPHLPGGGTGGNSSSTTSHNSSLVLGGLLLLWIFLLLERHLEAIDGEPLVRPSIFANTQLTGGLTLFFFQFFLQMGFFFTIPLFLSVVLELTEPQTGLRLLPLSVALLVSAAGIPRVAPRASPRRVVQLGLLSMIAGTLVLIGGLDLDATAAVVAVPLLLVGGGIGALASQLGAITVSALPDERSTEVGGLQNTATNLGASLGTALVGSVLIASLTAAVVEGIEQSPALPPTLKASASVELQSGVPFLSDTALASALRSAGVPPETATVVIDVNRAARIGALRSALMVVALAGVVALHFTSQVPSLPPGRREPDMDGQTAETA